MTICNLSYKEVGPYAQTLFLGCSVISVGQNLAWGAEQSTCTVRLIRDFSSHPSDPAFDVVNTNIDTIVASSSTSTLFDSANLDNTDTAKTLQKNIALEEQTKETYRKTEDINNTDKNSLKDNGKKCWNPHNYTADPVNWLGPDPGFIGDGAGMGFMGGNEYMVVGVPCFFKFEDIQFGGYVQKWNNENGIYTVELAGPGSYLKGAQLILSDYYGSISTTINSATAVNGQALAVPYADTGINIFNGSVYQGNIPNVFNIFGYLQSKGFDKALISENGINAAQVYDTLVELLNDGNDSPGIGTIVKNQFSPYGAIVGKSLIEFTGEGAVDFITPQNAQKSYGGSSINYTQLGILNHKTAVDNIPRPLFRLDLSQVPRPNSNIYLPLQKSMTIEDFINFCCNGAGVDWNSTLDPDYDGSDFTGSIIINTYERKIQPPPNALKSWLRSFTAQDRVVSYNLGEEYSDSSVRKIIIGGKQERLFQVMSNTLSKYRNWRIFDPIDSKFIDVSSDLDTANLTNDRGNFRNVMRIPNTYAQRAWDQSYGGPYRVYGGAATAQVPNDFKTTVNIEASNINVMKGSYTTVKPQLKSPLQGVTVAGGSYPIYYDLISPYFGRDSNGQLRKVFYDRKLKQLQVNIALKDIMPFFPAYSISMFTNYMTIYEDEIRAALAGFDSWMCYIFDPVTLGFAGTPTAKLIFAFIREHCGDSFADALALNGLGILKGNTKMSALPSDTHSGDPIGPAGSVMYSEAIYTPIKKLHQFVASNLGDHYGKRFLVRLPTIKRRVDPVTGKANYSYQICDSGWEEQGNFLDDTMQIGSTAATALAKENGKFGPIIGYHASAEEDRTLFYNLDSDSYGMMNLSAHGKIFLQLMAQWEKRSNNKWYFPLVHDIPMDELVLLEHKTYSLPDNTNRGANTFTSLPITRDSFGSPVPDGKKYKMYIKGNIASVATENVNNQQILFTNNAQYCVIESSHKVHQRSHGSLQKALYDMLYAQTVNGLEVALDNSMMYGITSGGGLTASQLLFLICYLDANITNGLVANTTINNESNLPIAPKCPLPCFAAIPYRDNLSVYGPWTSHPGLIKDIIFPDFSEGSEKLVNNIVGGVDIDISEGYNPWDYGGMDNLDLAILTQLSDNNKYQQVIEAGTMTIAGIMLKNTNIGSTVFGAGSPMVNSIQVEMGEDGYRTTYHFRTYSRKLGFFNQENAKNIQLFGKQAMETKKLIVDNTRASLAQNSSLQDPSSDRAGKLPKALSYSPVSILVGAAVPIVHKQSALTDVNTQLGFDPTWNMRPKIPSTISSNPKDMLRHQTSTSLYDPQELKRIIWKPEEWAAKSIMSLDGILSPISFYPTPYGTTYPITKYKRSNCPHCKGTASYTYKSYDNFSQNLSPTSTGNTTTSNLNTSVTQKTKPCDFCVPDTVVSGMKKNSARPSEVSPPFILASGDDRTIISDRNTAFQYSSSVINAYTLNPLVMSATGSDFSCYINKQSSDKCGHAIDVVGFGNVMLEPGDSLRASLSKTINKNYNDYDLNLIAASSGTTPNSGFQNVRSFGLRGPLMLHSWGYDLEGYPVPNSSGEPKVDAQGNAVVDSSGNPVYKNQVQQPDGSYSKAYKEPTFYKSWAQLPTTWPVGPIDLRWDDTAKVWTIGANYKPVWVVIENDLLNKDPVRGIVFDALYDDTPLPSGLRKLVFVRDTVGMFSSPRGSALYCRYDSRNGFYEPIYNRPLVTTGLINAGNTATIYQAYTPSGALRSDGVISTYNTAFDNPLAFNASANSIGLFTFLNGKWILQAVKE
jgi:hypothetical protein